MVWLFMLKELLKKFLKTIIFTSSIFILFLNFSLSDESKWKVFLPYSKDVNEYLLVTTSYKNNVNEESVAVITFKHCQVLDIQKIIPLNTRKEFEDHCLDFEYLGGKESHSLSEIKEKISLTGQPLNDSFWKNLGLSTLFGITSYFAGYAGTLYVFGPVIQAIETAIISMTAMVLLPLDMLSLFMQGMDRLFGKDVEFFSITESLLSRISTYDFSAASIVTGGIFGVAGLIGALWYFNSDKKVEIPHEYLENISFFSIIENEKNKITLRTYDKVLAELKSLLQLAE